MKMTIVAAVLGITTCMAGAREGEFGVGLTLGDPTGITGKYWLDEQSAVDAAAAWSLDEDGFNFHMDYLRHVFDTMKDAPATQWAWHYGLGGRLKIPEDNNGRGNDDDPKLGVRVPLGFDFYPSKVPLEFFVEIAPVLNLVPDTDFDMEFVVGARFYFR